MGIRLKTARAAARKAAEIERLRAEGLPIPSAAGTLSEERREQLEEIDPSWCPTWPVEWQRAFRLTRQHLDEGGELPKSPGDVVRQGEGADSRRPQWWGGSRWWARGVSRPLGSGYAGLMTSVAMCASSIVKPYTRSAAPPGKSPSMRWVTFQCSVLRRTAAVGVVV